MTIPDCLGLMFNEAEVKLTAAGLSYETIVSTPFYNGKSRPLSEDKVFPRVIKQELKGSAAVLTVCFVPDLYL